MAVLYRCIWSPETRCFKTGDIGMGPVLQKLFSIKSGPKTNSVEKDEFRGRK
jgi:hypothetical protein